MQPVYLDHNATTPISGGVLDAMAPYLRGQFGNPLTAHRFGAGPRAAIESARRDVAGLFGAQDRDDCRVVFCSGGSEAINHVMKGLAFASLANGQASRRRRIVIGAMEHPAVNAAAAWLEAQFGFEVVSVEPDGHGVVSASEFLAAVDPETTLLAELQWANNEVGTVQPVRAIGPRLRKLGVPFLCDVVQCPGKLDLRGALDVADALPLSAHKLCGPKGMGALVMRRDLELAPFSLVPLVHGAQQEDGQRAGTHNAAGIVGLGAAARAAAAGLDREAPRLARMRDALVALLKARVEGLVWNGEGAELLPNTLNVSVPGCPSHLLCEEMDARGFAISAGAACRAGDVTPSANLLAMGLDQARASSSVRISFGHSNRDPDVPATAEAFVASVAAVRRTQ